MARFKGLIFAFILGAAVMLPASTLALTTPDNLTSGTFTQRDLTWTMGTHTYTINLSDTGDVVFQDNGTVVWTFNDSGALVAGSTAYLNLGAVSHQGVATAFGLQLPKCGAAPGALATEGFLCYSDSLNALRINVGGSWTTLPVAGGAIALANSETFSSDADAEFDFTRNDAGGVTLMCKDDAGAVGSCTLTGAGASPVIIGTTGVGGTTAITLGTDGTGDGEVVLPAGSVSGTEVANDTLDAAQLADVITLDAAFAVTGEAISLNTSSNFGVNVCIGTSTGPIVLGGGLGLVSVNSSDWDISTTGAATGLALDCDAAGMSCSNVNVSADVIGTLPVANGGTGLTAGTSGGILGYTAVGTLASSALLNANGFVIGNGAGATPTAIAPCIDGQVAVGATGVPPVCQSLGGDVTSVSAAGVVVVNNAATGDALSANGANCAAGEFNKGVSATGAAESCAVLADSDIPDNLTLTCTPTAALNGGITVDGTAFAVADTTGVITTSHPNTLTTGAGATVAWAGATTATGTGLDGLLLNMTNVSGAAAAGVNGLRITDVGTPNTMAEYGLYVQGVDWDWAIWTDTDAYFGGGLTVNAGTVALPDGEIGAAEIANTVCVHPISLTFDPTEIGATDDYVSLVAIDTATGNASYGSAEGNEDQWMAPVALYADNLSVAVSAAPGVGNDAWTITLRETAGSTTLTCTIDEAAVTCADAVAPELIAASARLDVLVTSGGPGADPTGATEMTISFCLTP